MAHSVSPSLSKILPSMVIAFWLVLTNAYGTIGCNYKSIISFGDSLADTGNSLHSDPGGREDNLPYGETYFHHPTGRYSDGRIIIDFFAESLGLPLVPPYLGGGDFKQGVNFAVGGATALNATYFEERSIPFFTNKSLDVQLRWFQKLLPSLCGSSSECNEFLGRSLFLVGEIGGNDYNYPFFQGKSVEVIRAMVPEVINAISSAITILIAHGAATLVVPGNLPIGCSAVYLTIYESQNKDDYDPQTGCLNWLNEFAQYHNSLLEKELDRLQALYPNTTIIYANYYDVSMLFYRSPGQYGFNGSTLKACCGGGGTYNIGLSSNNSCGSSGATVCSDPSSYVSWDGIHLTEAAYRWIATGLLQGPDIVPHINLS